MNRIILLSLITLSLTSCFGGRFFYKKPQTENRPPAVKIIPFEEVDINNDGDISREELEVFNRAEERHSSDIDLKKPLIYSGILLFFILIACAHRKIINFSLGFFKKK